MRMNFNKTAPLFKGQVLSVLASGMSEEGFMRLKGFTAYNPLFSAWLEDIQAKGCKVYYLVEFGANSTPFISGCSISTVAFSNNENNKER